MDDLPKTVLPHDLLRCAAGQGKRRRRIGEEEGDIEGEGEEEEGDIEGEGRGGE